MSQNVSQSQSTLECNIFKNQTCLISRTIPPTHFFYISLLWPPVVCQECSSSLQIHAKVPKQNVLVESHTKPKELLEEQRQRLTNIHGKLVLFVQAAGDHSDHSTYSDTESFKHKILCLVCLFILKCSENIEYTLFNSSSNKEIFKTKSTSPYRAWL